MNKKGFMNICIPITYGILLYFLNWPSSLWPGSKNYIYDLSYLIILFSINILLFYFFGKSIDEKFSQISPSKNAYKIIFPISVLLIYFVFFEFFNREIFFGINSDSISGFLLNIGILHYIGTKYELTHKNRLYRFWLPGIFVLLCLVLLFLVFLIPDLGC